MPRKAVSKKQWRFYKAVESGKAKKKPKGFSPAEAREMLVGQPTPKGLPERSKSSKSKSGGSMKRISHNRSRRRK